MLHFSVHFSVAAVAHFPSEPQITILSFDTAFYDQFPDRQQKCLLGSLFGIQAALQTETHRELRGSDGGREQVSWRRRLILRRHPCLTPLFVPIALCAIWKSTACIVRTCIKLGSPGHLPHCLSSDASGVASAFALPAGLRYLSDYHRPCGFFCLFVLSHL